MICKIGEKYLWLYVNIYANTIYYQILYTHTYTYIDIIYNIFFICEHLLMLIMQNSLFVTQVNIIGVMSGTEIALERMKKAI